jgi:hypothetical protein
MPVKVEPPLYLTAALVNGVATVVFPSKPYPRLIRSIWFNSVVPASVTLSRGGSASVAVITSNAVANPNTYNDPFILPGGQSIFVVFSAAASPVNAAAAKLVSMREWSQ